MVEFVGSPDKCFYCDEKASGRTGIVYRCEWHKLVNEIVMQAQSSAVLIVKNGEYWDYKADVLAAFIDEKLAPLRMGIKAARIAGMEKAANVAAGLRAPFRVPSTRTVDIILDAIAAAIEQEKAKG